LGELLDGSSNGSVKSVFDYMVDETIQPEKMSRLSRMVRSRKLVIVLTVAVVVPVIWFSSFRSAAQAPVACDVQYDALVKQAKEQLINGDRNAAVNSLIAARTKLRDCETPSAKDVAPIWSN
jgi:hypothetical protein